MHLHDVRVKTNKIDELVKDKRYMKDVHISRSPRWTSGSPRMLLVLIREFESRRGKISNLFAKKTGEKDQLLTEPSVGKHNSTRVGEGRKS